MPNHTTFTDGKIDGVHVVELTTHADERGWLMELYRSDEIAKEQIPTMGYASETNPGMARGPHQHQHQTDHFVVTGPGVFEFCLWDDREDSPTYGKRMVVQSGAAPTGKPQRITVPAGVVHAYKNISDAPALLLNFPDQLYAGPGRNQPVDEIRFENVKDHPFIW